MKIGFFAAIVAAISGVEADTLEENHWGGLESILGHGGLWGHHGHHGHHHGRRHRRHRHRRHFGGFGGFGGFGNFGGFGHHEDEEKSTLYAVCDFGTDQEF